jgi:uncharacterized protein YjeT (DUF2065 family)
MAFGLVLVIEGLTYALVPGQLKRMMAGMMELSNEQLRLAGTGALAVGVLMVWLARSFLNG